MYNEHYEENIKNLPPMYLPCGGLALFDESSGIAYRCENCMAVVGSIGQPQRCKDEAQKYENWKNLGGAGWDYIEGKPEEKKVKNDKR
jgi:hypothetical protein